MRKYVPLFLLMALITALPAHAQGTLTYFCTVDGSSGKEEYQIGNGELRIFDRGAWSDNWCARGGTACKYEGSRFVAGGGDEDFEFIYDASTGRYSRDDLGGRYSGTCRAV